MSTANLPTITPCLSSRFPVDAPVAATPLLLRHSVQLAAMLLRVADRLEGEPDFDGGAGALLKETSRLFADAGVVPAAFVLEAEAVITVRAVDAYDGEAAGRYVRETLDEARADLAEALTKLDGAGLRAMDAEILLPVSIETETTLTDGEEGDPHETMATATFDVSAKLGLRVFMNAPASLKPDEVIVLARAVLAQFAAVRIGHPDVGMSSELKLADPVAVKFVERIA